MATPILMPKLSFIVTQGTIIEWLKKPGDSITKGEPLLVIESEKATVDVESPGTGIVGPELAPVGTTVPVTTVIGYLVEPGETPPTLLLESEPGAPGQASGEAEPEQAARGMEAGEREVADRSGRLKASPSAKRLAQEYGIDLQEIQGTGPGGRIVQEDVQAFADARARSTEEIHPRATPVARKLASELSVDLAGVEGSGPGGRVTKADIALASEAAASGDSGVQAQDIDFEVVDLNPIQRITAERMALSFGTAPHFYLSMQVDMSQAVAMRQALLPAIEATTGLRLSFTDILLCATGRALAKHPALNASFEQGHVKRYRDVNVCLAVDTPRGLTVPVFHKIDALTLAQITARRSEVVDRAMNNRLTPDDLDRGTFTVSNLGMFGIDVFNAIVNPPQAAILAVGRIAKRPVVVDDALELLPTMWVSLSVDHRVADGATASRFLRELAQHLEDPYRMVV
jgi:pyruvate dehydrogenase E2 component (dihydrolipoamide acetyltransferase)